jgi:hypothetical protein
MVLKRQNITGILIILELFDEFGRNDLLLKVIFSELVSFNLDF